MGLSRAAVMMLAAGLLVAACGTDEGDDTTSRNPDQPDAAADGTDATAEGAAGEEADGPGEPDGPDASEEGPDTAAECDAAGFYWSPDGLRSAVPDPGDVDGVAIVDMDRADLELLACDVARRIAGPEDPMTVFETMLVEWTSLHDPLAFRSEGWADDAGRYAGLTPTECAEALVVATFIGNVDETVLGNLERAMPGQRYVEYTAVCDG